MKANIQAVSLKIQTLKSQNAMGQAMKGVTKAMQNMNRYMLYVLFKLLYNNCTQNLDSFHFVNLVLDLNSNGVFFYNTIKYTFHVLLY